MRECLAEGMIQAFVDGELAPEMAASAATHFKICAACAAALSEAENELVLLNAAFAPELGLPVPTERLRERLELSLNELRSQASAPEKAASRSLFDWLSALVPSFNFAPRHALGLASLMAVAILAATFAFVAVRRNGNQSSLAVATNGRPETQLREHLSGAQKALPTGDSVTTPTVSLPVKFNRPRRAVSSPVRPNRVAPEPQLLPGEQTFLNTIASLSTIVENNGDSALKPSLRADYERNLALVNQAIDSTRRTARHNPKDADAAEFLYASYQSKIDLLSTVAEQGQMLAVAR